MTVHPSDCFDDRIAICDTALKVQLYIYIYELSFSYYTHTHTHTHTHTEEYFSLSPTVFWGRSDDAIIAPRRVSLTLMVECQGPAVLAGPDHPSLVLSSGGGHM